MERTIAMHCDNGSLLMYNVYNTYTQLMKKSNTREV